MKAKAGRPVELEVRHGSQRGNHNETWIKKRRRKEGRGREGEKKEGVEGGREIRERTRRETEKEGEEK